MLRLIFSLIALLWISLSANALKIISGPYLQNVTETGASFMWRTDKDATAWVEIAPTDDSNFYSCERPRFYATDLGRAVVGKVHKVTIDGLKPGTTYRYRIFSEEVVDQQPYHVTYGDVASSNVYSKKPLEFTTLSPGKKELNIVVVNDVHSDNEKLTDLVGGVKNSDVDFVIFNGDMTNYMDNEQSIFDGFIDKSVELFAAETPFFMSRGNHETRGNWAKEFMRYFPTPTGKPYYSFNYGPLFVIVLDGGEDKPDNDIEYSRTSFFDDYRRAEAKWLKEVVASDEFKNASYRIVVTHIPPVNDKWHGPLHSKELFLPILNEAGIDLMLCGHLHKYVYCEPGTDGAKFPIIINSNNEGLKINVNPDRINVDIYGRDGNTTKTFTYPASHR